MNTVGMVLSVSISIALLTACNDSQVAPESAASMLPTSTGSAKLVLISDVEWQALNPARGDQSPKAGTLWGDRNGTVPTGFLVSFVDGFSSPPHIHNVTYRGMVIRGLVHNDDPAAEKMWMPAGSFWTQPAGETHITAAQGSSNMAYIEIDEGPYLVRPTEEQFDNGERPVNVDPSNIVWLDAADINWMAPAARPGATNGLQVAFLWGHQLSSPWSGTLIKLPAKFMGEIHNPSAAFRAVVISGQITYHVQDTDEVKNMEPGSYFGSEGETIHRISTTTNESLIYIRARNKFNILPVEPGK